MNHHQCADITATHFRLRGLATKEPRFTDAPAADGVELCCPRGGTPFAKSIGASGLSDRSIWVKALASPR